MPQLKEQARQIFHETLAAIDIPATMQRKLQRKGTVLLCGGTKIDLRNFEKLRVVAIGKAAHAMVEGLRLVLAPCLGIEGIVSAPTAAQKPLPGWTYRRTRNRRWRPDLRFPTRPRWQTRSASALSIPCTTTSRSRCDAGLTKGKCRRRRKQTPPHFETRISSCCWEWMICFIRRITPRKPKDSSPVATTQAMTGRWRKPQYSCWNSWRHCGKHTRGIGLR